MSEFLYTTPKCPHCHQTSSIILNKQAFDVWQAGEYLQDAFPTLNESQRELVKTGFHPECWKIVFEGADF